MLPTDCATYQYSPFLLTYPKKKHMSPPKKKTHVSISECLSSFLQIFLLLDNELIYCQLILLVCFRSSLQVNTNILFSDMRKPKLVAEIAKQLRRFHEVEIPGCREPQLWNDISKFFSRGVLW